jgi:hypothetical protein
METRQETSLPPTDEAPHPDRIEHAEPHPFRSPIAESPSIPDIYDAEASPFWDVVPISTSGRVVVPLRRLEDLRGDFWPEDEDIETFLKTIRRWRDEDDTRHDSGRGA